MTAQDAGSFYAGFLQPLFVPAHVLTLLGLGLFIAQQRPANRRALQILFALALVATLFGVIAAFAMTNAQLYLLAATAVAGLLVAAGRPVSIVIGGPLVLIAGASFEFDAVPQEISVRTSTIMLVGSGLCALVVVAVVADLAAGARQVWLRTGLRILGSWTAASAALVRALRLMRLGD
jgi:urease accessory protein